MIEEAISNFGVLSYYSRMKFADTKYQKKYVEDVVRRFNMFNCSIVIMLQHQLEQVFKIVNECTVEKLVAALRYL